jgi:hypothetical protein
VNFYAAHIYDDTKFIQDPLGLNRVIKHNKINMFGTAWNFLSGSWLFKTELAYFDKLRYTMAPDKKLSRTDGLFGVEYNGIADTMISYDISLRHFNSYDPHLELEYIIIPGGEKVELIPVKRDTWQHAFRISSDFMNASLHANYLITLLGSSADEGGFQRLWFKYDLNDAVSTNVGIIDYIGGSKLFDMVEKNDLVYMDISYSF